MRSDARKSPTDFSSVVLRERKTAEKAGGRLDDDFGKLLQNFPLDVLIDHRQARDLLRDGLDLRLSQALQECRRTLGTEHDQKHRELLNLAHLRKVHRDGTVVFFRGHGISCSSVPRSARSE